MKTSALSLIAGAAMFGAASAASAAPMTLSTDQLDQVYAGRASVSAQLVGDAIVDGTFLLDNLPGKFSVANINATITPFGPATVTLEAKADTLD